MKKISTILCTLALLFGVVGAANAKTLAVDLSALPSELENTFWSWDETTSTGTFSWKATYWNSTQLFGAGDYSAYATLNLVTAAGTADHFRIIMKFTNGKDQVTINPVAVGTVSLKLREYASSTDLAAIESIRLSGANDGSPSAENPLSITVSQIYLEGSDSVDPETPEGTKVPVLLLKEGEINSTGCDIEPIAPSTLTTDNLYAATFTPKADFQNIFQYKNWDVSGYDKIVIVFGSPVSGDWHINLPSNEFPTIAAGTEQYEIDLTNVNSYADFTIFNWSGERTPITIAECYLVKSENDVTYVKVPTGFGDEITSLDYLTAGNKFTISDGTNILYFSGSQDAKKDQLEQLPADGYFYYTLTKIDGLDFDGDSEPDDDIYAINIINEEGTAFPAPYGLGNNINFTNWGSIFSGSAQADKGQGYGTDTQYQGIWKVNYTEGQGFSFKNCARNTYLKVTGENAEEYFLTLNESIVFEEQAIENVVKEDVAANAEIFALSKAAGYDAETGVGTNLTWTFAEPVSILDWDYIVITTSNTASDASHEISITDADGVTVSGEGYVGNSAGTGGNMWLDRWNNQNAIRISVDYLRLQKHVDVKKIKSLKINGTISVANVYLTDYNNTKIKGGYSAGDVVREYAAASKWGTICLPYTAAYAGAKVYSVVGKENTYIALQEVTGLLEAGVPYFYISTDVNGRDNGGAVCNVNFFRADLEKFDVTEPSENNGLVGVFEATSAPTDAYVLSNNELYKVDSDVNVGANKAYLVLEDVETVAGVRSAFIGFDNATGIITLSEEGKSEIYNLAGQRVNKAQKGIFIVNGKKVVK